MTKPITAADVTREALKILEHELDRSKYERINMQTRDGEVYEFCNVKDGWSVIRVGMDTTALKNGMTEDEMYATLKLLRK